MAYTVNQSGSESCPVRPAPMRRALGHHSVRRWAVCVAALLAVDACSASDSVTGTSVSGAAADSGRSAVGLHASVARVGELRWSAAVRVARRAARLRRSDRADDLPRPRHVPCQRPRGQDRHADHQPRRARRVRCRLPRRRRPLQRRDQPPLRRRVVGSARRRPDRTARVRHGARRAVPHRRPRSGRPGGRATLERGARDDAAACTRAQTARSSTTSAPTTRSETSRPSASPSAASRSPTSGSPTAP